MAGPSMTRIGKYEIRREIGRGGMGIVYEGFDPHIQRRVAIKVIRPEILDRDEASHIVVRFKREAQAGGRLSHPGIVPVYEYGEEADYAFIAMEFVEGRGLKSFFEARERFALDEVVAIMTRLLEALDYAHRGGVVHRDIKPANIIVTPDRQIKVADFGLARIESSTLTQDGAVMGTPAYMSPEQMRGIEADGRSDLFSAGVILYELLTGQRPFVGGSIAVVMHQLLHETPVDPSQLAPGVPPEVGAVTLKALAKRPEERFQTALEFAESLAVAARGGSRGAETLLPAAAPAAAVPAAPAALVSPLPRLAPALLTEAEAQLARHLGPLARVIMRRAAEKATSAEEFCRLVAEELPENQRAQFRANVASMVEAPLRAASREASLPGPAGPSQLLPPDSTPPGWDQATLALVERRLAAYIGPVARVLVKKAAASTTRVPELYQLLAQNIEGERERQAFLATVDRAS